MTGQGRRRTGAGQAIKLPPGSAMQAIKSPRRSLKAKNINFNSSTPTPVHHQSSSDRGCLRERALPALNWVSSECFRVKEARRGERVESINHSDTLSSIPEKLHSASFYLFHLERRREGRTAVDSLIFAHKSMSGRDVDRLVTGRKTLRNSVADVICLTAD